MLTAEENERITRVGPSTEMGECLRRYWWPLCLSTELAESDGPPLRVRLLGEDLIAFRDTSGSVGLVSSLCPHRRAPLFFGRNEEYGLRCVYHGWKFDRFGNCVDMPSEPAGTALQAKVKLCAYATYEAGGVVWCYMGPKDLQGDVPDFEWMRAPIISRYISKTIERCNWLQGLEGGFDTSHSSFLHCNSTGDQKALRQRDRSPKVEVQRTDYGCRYVSIRNIDREGKYVRVYHYIMPAYQMRGNVAGRFGEYRELPRINGHIWVPMDDETTAVYNWILAYNKGTALDAEWLQRCEARMGRGPDDLIPGTFQLKRNLSNDYLINRETQKVSTYTGIFGINTQDFAVQEGMGTICDRSKEFLGTSDKAIVLIRRLLFEAIELVANGGQPRGLASKAYRNLRPHDGIVPSGDQWHDCFADDLVAKW